MIDLEKITERKEVIAKDIETVRARLGEYDKQKEKDTALLNALMGAYQQCDAFAKDLDNDTADEDTSASDVENSEDPDEAIGGTD